MSLAPRCQSIAQDGSASKPSKFVSGSEGSQYESIADWGDISACHHSNGADYLQAPIEMDGSVGSRRACCLERDVVRWKNSQRDHARSVPG